MSSFSDFVNNNNSEKTNFTNDELIEKYSKYSPDELMNEFIIESAKKKERGELTEEDINKIKKCLGPYLTLEQKDKLNQLLDMVK